MRRTASALGLIAAFLVAACDDSKPAGAPGAAAASKPATSEEAAAFLLQDCKGRQPPSQTCECQVKAMTDNLDPKALRVMVTVRRAEAASEDPDTALNDALAAEGITVEQYHALLSRDAQKAHDAVAACTP